MSAVKDDVKRYYGETIQRTSDLKTSACCCPGDLPPYLRDILARIAPEIREKSYGCGSPLPPALEGATVLDLGCGTGRDVYVAAALVGPGGRVIGVDMTEKQLDVARRHLDDQMRAFGYERPNVEFHHGDIEDLAALGLADRSVDVVISNCVLNLAPDKSRVFAEIVRVLKDGGELFFADVMTGRRVPESLRRDPVLVGECLAGALYREDFRRLMAELGVPDVRIVDERPLDVTDPELNAKIGMIPFASVTVRAFRLADLEPSQEDYGQIATYLGTIRHEPHRFRLDADHVFVTGQPTPVSGNTAAMLSQSRYARHFRVTGDRSTHFGPFRPAGRPAAGTGC